jgi:hypothetical protein
VSKIIEAIRKAIEKGDKSRYRLWQETGIDQSHLRKVLRGEARLSYENLEGLADALDLEIIVRPKRKGK